MAAKSRRTKLPSITRLPSGAYHTRVTYTDTDGKRKAISITDYDYNTVVLRAAEAMADRKQDKVDKQQGKVSMSLAEAIEAYIDSKSAVLSPSTMRSYRTIHRNYLKTIMDRRVSDITQAMIQTAINIEAMTHSPKTVRNIHGLLSAVMQVYRPDLILHTTLPQKKKPTISVPTEEDIKKLFDLTNGTDMEIPVLLGAVCGMRRGEIGALTWDSIDFNKGTITIDQSLVLSDDHEWIEKTTKTTAGTRTIRMIPMISTVLQRHHEATEGKGDYITIRPDLISNRFYNLIRRSDLPQYRFHDLRHYTVSVMLSLGVPPNYIAGYVGHDGTRMVETVYGHLMTSRKTTVEDQMQVYFEGVFKPK